MATQVPSQPQVSISFSRWKGRRERDRILKNIYQFVHISRMYLVVLDISDNIFFILRIHLVPKINFYVADTSSPGYHPT